jgi:predicted ATP-binding protein involved in virulence
MRIDELHLKNFRCFAEDSFSFNPHFTVIIGENASGKTAILDALSVALGSFFLGIPGLSKPYILKSDIRVVTQFGQPTPQDTVTVEAKGKLDGEGLTWKREILKVQTTSKDAKVIANKAEEKRKARIHFKKGTPQPIFPLLAYHTTARLFTEHTKVSFKKQGDGLEAGYTNSLSAKSSSKTFLEWFKTKEDSVQKFKDPLDQAQLKLMREIIMEIIPEKRVSQVSFDRQAEDLAVLFKDNQGVENKLFFHQLSDGFRNTITLVADLAYRCVQLNRQLGEDAVKETPGVVLIDEIDMHLHPNWQKRIVGDLKRIFPKVQFIATTHSPFVVQSLEADELINLEEKVNTAPKQFTLGEVATDFMHVKGIRSDDFEARFLKVQEKLDALSQSEEPTLDDYLKIKEELGRFIENETDDPDFKAYLNKKNNAE